MNTTATSLQSIPTGEKLTVGVVGLGYLGAVHAAGMAALGHRVVGYDVDARKVDALSRAQAPFFEPGLEELLDSTQGDNLLFTHDKTDLKSADVVFVAVGTRSARASWPPTPPTSSPRSNRWPSFCPARR
jgi:UDPglucose 6-dehydrogenase